MLFKNISILDENFQIRNNIYLKTEDEIITYIGEKCPNQNQDKDKEEESIDGKGLLLLPGFYNSHAHSPMSLLRGYGEGLELHEWLNKKIFPFEKTLNIEDVYWGSLLSMAESMSYGIVSTTDMYFLTDGLAKAVLDSGMKANISRSVSNTSRVNPHDDITFKEMVYTNESFQGIGSGRIIVDASLHAEYTNDEPTIKAVADYAIENNLRTHIHLAETEREVIECRRRYGGISPVELLLRNGVFDVKVTAAHCVWLDDRDREILRDKKVTVASCPVSNLKLASGICDVNKLFDEGIRVTIGTDGASSNNSLNFFEEMKIFALLGKYKSKNPARMKAFEVIKSATIDGAIAQGREACGSLKVGNRADIIAIDIESPSMNPRDNLINNIVYSSSGRDVRMTMVDGKILYKDGEFTTLDIEKIKYEVGKRSAFQRM